MIAHVIQLFLYQIFELNDTKKIGSGAEVGARTFFARAQKRAREREENKLEKSESTSVKEKSAKSGFFYLCRTTLETRFQRPKSLCSGKSRVLSKMDAKYKYLFSLLIS